MSNCKKQGTSKVLMDSWHNEAKDHLCTIKESLYDESFVLYEIDIKCRIDQIDYLCSLLQHQKTLARR